MTNYFRITAYHPDKDVSAIFDSNGLYEKLWQFSAFLVSKGFKIIEVGNEDKFLNGNIDRAEEEPEKLILRATAPGKPEYTSLEQNGVSYRAVQVKNKVYVPDKTQTA